MEIDQLWLALVGALVVAAVVWDLLATTLAVGLGRGRITDAVVRSIRWLSRRGDPTHRRLALAGVLGAAAVPAVWILLLWLGFSLTFLADDDAVVVASTQEPASTLGRIAFAAGGLAGAGASLVAGTATWELVNNLAAIVGLALVTLGLTYIFQVVTSVKNERATASNVTALGPSPSEAVAAALAAPGLGTLPLQLAAIAERISDAAQGHLTLPMIQLFHGEEADSNVGLNLARFDEIVTLLAHAVPEDHTPTVWAGRQAVDGFLSTQDLVRRDVGEVPPLPSLAPLRAVRDDVVDDATFAARCEQEAERRARLHTFVRSELWTWDDVLGR